MATAKKSGIYSPVSFAAINLIARSYPHAPNLLIAYLVLARFAGMTSSHADYGPNVLVGAGVTAVSEKLKIQWSRAQKLILTLIDLKIIEPAEKGLRVGGNAALYVMQFAGDVQLPHALIDGLPKKVDETTKVDGITRLFTAESVQPPSFITAAMVALLHCYGQHDMNKMGGICSQAVHLPWLINSVKPEVSGFTINAERATGGLYKIGQDFGQAILGFMDVQSQNLHKTAPSLQAVFELLKSSGLMYEAVTLFHGNTPWLPVRINDLHGARSKSELSYIEAIPGAGFYRQKENKDNKPEGMHFLIPPDTSLNSCSLRGVMRLRFRCCDDATAKGLKRDAYNLQLMKQDLINCRAIDDLG